MLYYYLKLCSFTYSTHTVLMKWEMSTNEPQQNFQLHHKHLHWERKRWNIRWPWCGYYSKDFTICNFFSCEANLRNSEETFFNRIPHSTQFSWQKIEKKITSESSATTGPAVLLEYLCSQVKTLYYIFTNTNFAEDGGFLKLCKSVLSGPWVKPKSCGRWMEWSSYKRKHFIPRVTLKTESQF